MFKGKSLSSREVSAEIRNKLQAAMTILELLKSNKKVSKYLIGKALKDLEKLEGIISGTKDTGSIIAKNSVVKDILDVITPISQK